MSTLVVDNLAAQGGGTAFSHDGVAKLLYTYVQSTPAATATVNVSSITDNSTGDFTVNATNSMGNNSFPHFLNAPGSVAAGWMAYTASASGGGSPTTHTSSTLEVNSGTDSGTAQDGESYGSWQGDLA